MSSFNDRTADLLWDVCEAARKVLEESKSDNRETFQVPTKQMWDLRQAIQNYDKERGPGSSY